MEVISVTGTMEPLMQVFYPPFNMTEYKNWHFINNSYVDFARTDLFQKTAKQPFSTIKKKNSFMAQLNTYSHQHISLPEFWKNNAGKY